MTRKGSPVPAYVTDSGRRERARAEQARRELSGAREVHEQRAVRVEELEFALEAMRTAREAAERRAERVEAELAETRGRLAKLTSDLTGRSRTRESVQRRLHAAQDELRDALRELDAREERGS